MFRPWSLSLHSSPATCAVHWRANRDISFEINTAEGHSVHTVLLNHAVKLLSYSLIFTVVQFFLFIIFKKKLWQQRYIITIIYKYIMPSVMAVRSVMVSFSLLHRFLVEEEKQGCILRELPVTTLDFIHNWLFKDHLFLRGLIKISQFLGREILLKPSQIKQWMRGCLTRCVRFTNRCLSWLLEVHIWHYVVSCCYSVACWCIPVSHCPCVHSLFPSPFHPRPSSLPSTCRRSILTRWSSTSLWVHIPQHLIPSFPPQSPSPPSLSCSFCAMESCCIIPCILR